MPLSQAEWHKRFKVQAQWTEGLRLYFFNLIKEDHITRVLDIGCGTGALLPDLEVLSPGHIIGADLNLDYLYLAQAYSPGADLLGANVYSLPFPDNSFDVVLCHYFLMWVNDPPHALDEMKRVTRTGGTVVAFAEPDYGGRIDHPPQFNSIREYQTSALSDAGADPLLGRKLRSLFQQAGFSEIYAGVYQGSWSSESSQEEIDSEWKVLSSDLSGYLSRAELKELGRNEEIAREKGDRLVFVPTFYAWGKVPIEVTPSPGPFFKE